MQLQCHPVAGLVTFWVLFTALLEYSLQEIFVKIAASFHEKCFIVSSKITEKGSDLLSISKLMELYPACFLYVLCFGKHDLACPLSKLMQ